jgi:hypothetical protein
MELNIDDCLSVCSGEDKWIQEQVEMLNSQY